VQPLLDVVLFTRRLVAINGWQGPMVMYGWFVLSAILKKLLMPPLGKVNALFLALVFLWSKQNVLFLFFFFFFLLGTTEIVDGERIGIGRLLPYGTPTPHQQCRRNLLLRGNAKGKANYQSTFPLHLQSHLLHELSPLFDWK
jgi:hypothetical protein